jgi:site-specific recombinase XerD
VHSFFIDYLAVQKGLQPSSVHSYRDAVKLFLCFLADRGHRKISRLAVEDLTFEQVLAFLNYLENDRGNHVRTRNQRLAVLHAFFEYLARRIPEMLMTSQQVGKIPMKRVSPPETCFLEREHIARLFQTLPTQGRHALRDRALLLFLYNTGARVREVAETTVACLKLGAQPCVRLHGKGDKWRTCPLWKETTIQLQQLLQQRRSPGLESPVFVSDRGAALTRSGIYKLVRRHVEVLEREGPRLNGGHISPHVFRHTAAVHLLEAGVEVNVIRGWLGHVKLDTTNRYAEINLRTKEAALRACEPPDDSHRRIVWKNDESLLTWLNSL